MKRLRPHQPPSILHARTLPGALAAPWFFSAHPPCARPLALSPLAFHLRAPLHLTEKTP